MMENNRTPKNIIFTGGGTGGPVTPLLAVAGELLKDDTDRRLKLFFIGTASGPEREMVAAFNREIGSLEFISIPSGKWRRYFSLANFFDLFKIGAGYFRSIAILRRLRPQLVVSAGAFVSAPVVWAAAGLKIPVIIHQQDVRPGLANRLMAPFARVITVAFEKSLADYGVRAVWIGNPVRNIDRAECRAVWSGLREEYGWRDDLPTVLVTGGRMGAQALNEIVLKSRAGLSECQIIHLTGDGKGESGSETYPDYHPFENLSHQKTLAIMEKAEAVVARCGLGTLTELSALSKAAILIPIPHSHQEDNAAVFGRDQAAIVLDQEKLDGAALVREIKNLLADERKRTELGDRAGRVIKRGAADALAAMIWEVIK